MKVGTFIRLRRQELNITQQDLNDRLAARGVDGSYGRIGHWEAGRNEPPFEDDDFRAALASSLEMGEYDMLKVLGYSVQPDGKSDAAKAGATIIDRMSPAAQRAAVEVLRALERSLG